MSDSSSNSLASSIRCRVSQAIGVMPDSSRNRRVKWRTLIDSRAANCPSVIGSWSLRSAQSRAAEVPGADLSGTGRRMNCACPPSRWGGTTVRRATSPATAVP